MAHQMFLGRNEREMSTEMCTRSFPRNEEFASAAIMSLRVLNTNTGGREVYIALYFLCCIVLFVIYFPFYSTFLFLICYMYIYIFNVLRMLLIC